MPYLTPVCIRLVQHQMLPDEFVTTAIFHPLDEDILVTYGQQHLVLWQLMPDKTGTERKTFLSVSACIRRRCSPKTAGVVQQGYAKGNQNKVTVNAVAFLKDDTLLSGNTRGELVVWAPVHGDDGSLDFMQRVFPAHRVSRHTAVLNPLKCTSKAAISVIRLLGNQTVASSDFEGECKQSCRRY